MTSQPKRYRRYTNLPILFDMLINQRLTIVGYDSWLDLNDRYALSLFKERSPSIEFLGAYCLNKTDTQAFHQWKIFSDGESGVCVVFDGEGFRKFAEGLSPENYLFGDVEYIPYRQKKSAMDDTLSSKLGEVSLKRLPFAKRIGYQSEDESRIIYFGSEKGVRAHHIDFDLSLIAEIIISPFASDGLVDSIKTVLKKIDGCPAKLSKARLTDSKSWQSALDRYAARALETKSA